MRRVVLFLLAAACLLRPQTSAAQGVTGALIGTVKDAQGGVLQGATVRVSSTAIIGGPATLTTSEKGQLRLLGLPPGTYALEIEMLGFAPFHEEGIQIGAGATIERTVVLKLAGVEESVVVEGSGSRIEARDPGFGSRLARRISKRSRCGVLACSTSSGPPLECRRPRREAARPTASPRSAPVPTRTRSS
jgi:Carboxypeptidase regulatory-like domain